MKEFSISPWKLTRAWGNTGYIRTIKDAHGEHIAHVCDLDDALTESTANARLIAAAPDLLSALQGMLEYFCEDGYDDYSDTETVTAARAAIAKATAAN